MDKQQFEQEYGILSDKLDEIRQQEKNARNDIKKLKQDYINTFPFKVDDCVKINQKPLRATDQPRVMEKGWIKEIKVMVFGEDAEIILIVDKPKKNGTRSLIGAERFYNIKLDEVEVINK